MWRDIRKSQMYSKVEEKTADRGHEQVGGENMKQPELPMTKLNIGCQKDIKEGYVNLDAIDYEGVDVVWNLDKNNLSPSRREDTKN